MVARGEVWLVALDPTIGSEIQKTRPCVVVSPPELHDHLRTVIVAPMTTGGKPAPFRVPLTFQRKKGLVLLDQIRTVDKTRLVKKAGAVSDLALSNALSTLQEFFVE
ncbi:type II toxin-antitoxin system PemK/MazF family toxin [Paraburkholderia sp. BL10I2N1]|uniref:type II toxin-antitoxin system PemK/MazF family toxin n=1 Tax=Paraburkholderia sp. BL10I2N1 TaxID=1938796 RepID=UPI00105E3FFC|nr:type II toxin-antitoxin system PemK/MazF family toxin [Paraburkholderia sp. BL10I2N1]TDN63475.1 mRNA interferase MazF [Paraburkholderia sp. BL10I2N1]